MPELSTIVSSLPWNCLASGSSTVAGSAETSRSGGHTYAKREVGSRDLSRFTQAFNQSPGGGQLRFIVSRITRFCITASLEGRGDLRQRLLSHTEKAT
jgi:hypothetical protein